MEYDMEGRISILWDAYHARCEERESLRNKLKRPHVSRRPTREAQFRYLECVVIPRIERQLRVF